MNKRAMIQIVRDQIQSSNIFRDTETRERNVQHRQQKRLIKRKGRETSPSLNQNGSLTQSDKKIGLT